MTTEDRLAQIEKKLDHTCVVVETLSERMREHAERETSWNERISRTVYGVNGTPGLLVKLDRLEQAQQRHTWFARAVIGVMLGVVAALLSARVL